MIESSHFFVLTVNSLHKTCFASLKQVYIVSGVILDAPKVRKMLSLKIKTQYDVTDYRDESVVSY